MKIRRKWYQQKEGNDMTILSFQSKTANFRNKWRGPNKVRGVGKNRKVNKEG